MKARNVKTVMLSAIFAMAIATASSAQVFTRTVLDRPGSQPVAAMPISDVKSSLPTDFNVQDLQISGKEATVLGQLPKPKRNNAANAALDHTLKSLTEDKSDSEIQTICDSVRWALKNRWRPVQWKSERSVCFWNQPRLDWIKGAQIAGGGSQGTASVEVVSDVFWGVRVRVQTSVAGTDAADPDGQAKALLKQLQTSGGNVSIGATYPWYALESPTSRVTGLLTSYARVGGAIPALGADSSSTTITSTDANGSVELALFDSAIQLQSFRRTINFVVMSRGSIVDGTHKFNEAVKNTGHRGFAYGQVGVGLRFSQVVWLVASRTYYWHSLPGAGTTYTVLFGK